MSDKSRSNYSLGSNKYLDKNLFAKKKSKTKEKIKTDAEIFKEAADKVFGKPCSRGPFIRTSKSKGN